MKTHTNIPTRFGRLSRNLFVASLLAFGLGVATGSAQGTTPAGTEITSQAYADYEDVNGNAQARVFSNEVTTIVTQITGINLTPETASRTVAASETSVVAYVVTNTGNGTDSYTIQATGNTEWDWQLFKDINGNGLREVTENDSPGVLQTVNTGDLAPGQSYFGFLVVSVPADATDGESEVFTVTATSDIESATTDTGTYTFNVQAATIVVSKLFEDTVSFRPGDTVTYRILGENQGSASVDNVSNVDFIPTGTTYVPGSIRVGDGSSTYDTALPLTDADDGDGADFDISNPGAITLVIPTSSPGGITAGYFQVTINDDQLEGTLVSNQVETTYEVGGVELPKTFSNILTFQVDPVFGVDADPDQSGSGSPGELVPYLVTVTNEGNDTDAFNITGVSSSGATLEYYFAPGSGATTVSELDPLIDTTGDGIPDTGNVIGFQSIDIVVAVTLKDNASNGSVDTSTITATSTADTGDPKEADDVVLTTTVQSPVLNLVKSVLPTGDQPPGTELTYTVTATNSGEGTAVDVTVVDAIPEFTTYVTGSIRTAVGAGALTPRTDADDLDGAYYDSGLDNVTTDPTDIGPGSSKTLEFKVTID